MPKQQPKLSEKDLKNIIRHLPMKERQRLQATELTPEFIETELEKARKATKMDISIGIPWLVAYLFCVWKFGYTMPTLIIFAIGGVYFAHAIFTRGTYALNKRRIKTFEALQAKLS